MFLKHKLMVLQDPTCKINHYYLKLMHKMMVHIKKFTDLPEVVD